MGKRLAVTGGRTYADEATLNLRLDLKDPDVVIVGDADGADKLTRQWALRKGVPLMVFPAAWDFYGKAAGPQRNGFMIRYGAPDEALAFPGGRGTADMIRQCEAHGIPVERV